MFQIKRHICYSVTSDVPVKRVVLHIGESMLLIEVRHKYVVWGDKPLYGDYFEVEFEDAALQDKAVLTCSYSSEPLDMAEQVYYPSLNTSLHYKGTTASYSKKLVVVAYSKNAFKSEPFMK